MYPEQGIIAQMYHDLNTFDLREGQGDQESTNGIPCLVEWNSRNITISDVCTSLNVAFFKVNEATKENILGLT